jgi:hypothetical protein
LVGTLSQFIQEQRDEHQRMEEEHRNKLKRNLEKMQVHIHKAVV